MRNYTPESQYRIEFDLPFAGKLSPSNRWVVMSSLVDWDVFAKEYYKNFQSKEGRPPINARVVLGAVIIKHYYCLSDIETIEMIQENPYLQYFIGYRDFCNSPAFDPSLFVSIRKRMGASVFDALTNSIMDKATTKHNRKIKESSFDSEHDNSSDVNKTSSSVSQSEDANSSSSQAVNLPNKGKLQIDATVADAHIKYPTDLCLLNDARLKSEALIDYLCQLAPRATRPRTYRRKARQSYLNVAKKKKKSKKELRSAIRYQINCLSRNIKSINTLLDTFKRIPFDKHQYKYFLVIQELLRQQKQMFDTKTHSCEYRIVSIHQPHVRPIVRGKAKAKVEFGNKIDVCLQNGIATPDRFFWEAYNEGEDLCSFIEAYKKRWGYYPELVQVDKIYLTKANRKYLTERNIRHSGDPLGRKPKKENVTKYQKAKRKREAAERNHIEGKFGLAKTRYQLNRIRAKLACTSLTWINSIFLVMNLVKIHCAKFLMNILSDIFYICRKIKLLSVNFC